MTRAKVSMGLILFAAYLTVTGGLYGETLWEKLQAAKKRTVKTQNPDGTTHESTIVTDHASRGTKNEDGSITIEGARTVGTEKHGTFSHESETNYKRNEDGSAKWNSKNAVGNDKNPWGWKTRSSGSSNKTEDGSAWSNQKVIMDQKGNETTIDSKGRWVKNSDGTWTHIVDKTKTLHDGTVLSEQEKTTFEHTKEGLKWKKQSDKKNPWGNSSVTETGGATLGKDGLKWQSDKKGTNPWGKKWSASSAGKGKGGKDGTSWKTKHSAQTEDGKWKLNWGNKNKSTKDADGNVIVDKKVNSNLGGSKGEKFKAWLESLKKKQKK